MVQWIKKNWWKIMIVGGVVLFLIYVQEYRKYTEKRVEQFIEKNKDQ
tara:strand:- start:103 stop:243 length:141 start_codon:yes stop_codon:yes gene_type:complete